jgi:signal transduction histidine kinase
MSGVKHWERRFGILNVVCGVVLLLAGYAPLAGRENLPYRLNVAWHLQIRGPKLYYFADLDGNETVEIICITGAAPDYTLQFYRRPGDLIKEFNFTGVLAAESTPLDLENDGIKEYFVSEQIGDRAMLHAIWPFENRSKAIFSIIDTLAAKRHWEYYLYVRDMMDVNGDGKNDLIVYVKTNIGRPSSLLAIDWTSGKIIWERKLAGHINGYARIALDDGGFELLLATEGSNSRLRVDSMNDQHSYIIVIDSRTGAIRHVEPRGGSFTKIVLYPAGTVGLPENHFFFAVFDPKRTSYFEKWDAGSRRQVAKLESPELQCHFIADINRDKKMDVVFMNRAGTWQAVDTSLKFISDFPKALSFPPSVVAPSLPAIQSPQPILIPGTSLVGIVAQFPNRAGFMIFDDRLQPLASWDEGLLGEFRVIRRGKEEELFWATPDHVYLLQLKPNSTSTLFSRTWIVLTLVAAAFATLFYLAVQEGRRRAIERILQAMQSLGIGALVFQPPGWIFKTNRQMREILNLGDQDLQKRRMEEVLSAPQYAELLNIIHNGQRNGLAMPQRCVLPHSLMQKEFEVLMVSMKARFQWNRLAVLLLRDVTAEYAARKATFWAKTAQKLAHDLKNPLSSILMAVDHLAREYESMPSGRARRASGQASDDYINHIRTQVALMRKHTIGFVKFADLEKPKLEPLCVNELLTDAIAPFESTFGEHVKVNRELEEKLPTVMADAGQIRIVLNNLIDNAIAAMSNGGTLTLRTYLVSPLPDSDGSAQEYVAIEIHDTGCGISEEILKNIREQQLFVTTKPDGTGVGLVQVQEIISDHHGHFEITSTEGVGTMVYLALPIYREE